MVGGGEAWAAALGTTHSRRDTGSLPALPQQCRRAAVNVWRTAPMLARALSTVLVASRPQQPLQNGNWTFGSSFAPCSAQHPLHSLPPHRSGRQLHLRQRPKLHRPARSPCHLSAHPQVTGNGPPCRGERGRGGAGPQGRVHARARGPRPGPAAWAGPRRRAAGPGQGGPRGGPPAAAGRLPAAVWRRDRGGAPGAGRRLRPLLGRPGRQHPGETVLAVVRRRC